MKTKDNLLEEIILRLKKERQEKWIFYHEAQLWKEQKENADIYDELIRELEVLLNPQNQ